VGRLKGVGFGRVRAVPLVRWLWFCWWDCMATTKTVLCIQNEPVDWFGSPIAIVDLMTTKWCEKNHA
jgi:hypothetical protein